jgi:hypothetical protein
MARRLLNRRRKEESVNAQEIRETSSSSASAETMSEAPAKSTEGTARTLSASVAFTIEGDSEAPTKSPDCTARTRSASVTSITNQPETSIIAEEPDESPKKTQSKRLTRPEIRGKPANKKSWTLTPHTGRSRVAFLPNHQLLPTSSPYREPGFSKGQKAMLKRLKKKQRQQRAEQVSKPYKNLQREGKSGPGALY